MQWKRRTIWRDVIAHLDKGREISKRGDERRREERRRVEARGPEIIKICKEQANSLAISLLTEMGHYLIDFRAGSHVIVQKDSNHPTTAWEWDTQHHFYHP